MFTHTYLKYLRRLQPFALFSTLLEKYLSFKSAVSHQSLRGASFRDVKVRSTKRWLIFARFFERKKGGIRFTIGVFSGFSRGFISLSFEYWFPLFYEGC